MTTPFKDTRFEVALPSHSAFPEPERNPQRLRGARRTHTGRRGAGPRALERAEQADSMRLDRALRDHFPGASWSGVRELVTSGKVSVAGQRVVDPGYAVRALDLVEVRLTTPRQAKLPLPENALVYVDGEIVVVEKPAGISSVPFEDPAKPDGNPKNRPGHQPAALNQLVADVLFRTTPKAEREAAARGPLGVVQRLDKETSGLIVFARTVRAKKHLQQQLRQHTVHRRYLALAHGLVATATLQSRLVQNRGDGRRGSTERSDLGREAITHVRQLERLAGATLVECRLETGRTHQIRIHLAEAGHPLLGERVYAGTNQQPGQRLLPAPRVMLHAAELGFVHPTSGRDIHFRSALPRDFEQRLNELRE